MLMGMVKKIKQNLQKLLKWRLESAVQKMSKLLNFTYIKARIHSVGIRALVEEVSDARKADPNNTDLEKLGLALQLSQDALKYDPKQLPAQLLSRITTPTDGISPLLEQCRASDDLYLLPNQQVLLHSGGQLVHIVCEHNAMIRCMTMTSDGKYVITCSEDGTMVITNVMKGWRERKILQIGGLPEDVHLCCDEKLVVTATDQHVIAHSLETGKEEWMLTNDNPEWYHPFMTCVGPHQDTFIIFEERNMMFFEASTGTKVDTLELPKMPDLIFHSCFPAPCSNDKYVVATNMDHTYLILVDYTERKIVTVKQQIHDGPDDLDNSIQSLAITGCAGNEQYVIYATQTNGNLIFLDVPNLDMVKIYKDDERINSDYFHLSKDEQYLYFNSTWQGVCVWDLQNAQMCTILPKAERLTDVLTMDMKTFVTITTDCNVRIWDVKRGQEEQTSGFGFQDREVIRFDRGGEAIAKVDSENGEETDNFSKFKDRYDEKEKTRDVVLEEFITMESPRYMLVKIKINDTSFLQVYDVAMNTVIRSMQLAKDVAAVYLKGSQVLMECKSQLALVDMNNMEIITKFHGKFYKHFTCKSLLINGGKELLTATKGGHHLKVYDMQTGKATEIIKQERTDEDKEKHFCAMEDLMISKDCSMGVAEQEDQLIVFDLANHKMKSYITCKEFGQECLTIDSELSAITDNGHYLLFTGNLPEDPEKCPQRQECIVVYDLHAGSIVRHILDVQTALKYQVDKNEDTCLQVWGIHLLDNRTIIAAYDDFLIRVYDMNTGKMLHRLEGHQHIPSLIVREDCPVFLSHVRSNKENSIRMWSKSDFTFLASFTSDIKLARVYLLPGYCDQFVARPDMGKGDAPIIFSVYGKKKEALFGKQSPLTSYPELFKGKKLDGTLSLTPSDQADLDDDIDSDVLNDSEAEDADDDADDDDDEDDDDDSSM